MTKPEETLPLPDDRRPQAPPGPAPAEAEGPPEPAGARYASGPQTPPPLRVADGTGGDVRHRSGPGAVPNFRAPDPVAQRPRGPGADRPHLRPARTRQVKFRYSEAEYAAVAAAAADAGLTPSSYAARVALNVAQETRSQTPQHFRHALKEVMATRAQVRRFAVNVNQAVAVLHATGEPPAWLMDAVSIATRAVVQLDAAAAQLARALR